MTNYIAKYSLINGQIPSFISDGGYYPNNTSSDVIYVGVTTSLESSETFLHNNASLFVDESSLTTYFSTYFSSEPITDRGQTVAAETPEHAASVMFLKLGGL